MAPEEESVRYCELRYDSALNAISEVTAWARGPSPEDGAGHLLCCTCSCTPLDVVRLSSHLLAGAPLQRLLRLIANEGSPEFVFLRQVGLRASL